MLLGKLNSCNKLIYRYFLRGESEIRTREPVLPVTRFPGVPLQPLEHLSLRKAGAKLQLFSLYQTKADVYLRFFNLH